MKRDTFIYLVSCSRRCVYTLFSIRWVESLTSNHVKTNNVFSLFLNFLIALVFQRRVGKEIGEGSINQTFVPTFSSNFILRSIKYSLPLQTSHIFYYGFGYFSLKNIMRWNLNNGPP